MKLPFKVGDTVITSYSDIGTVISTTATFKWGVTVTQPIQVMFTSDHSEFYSEDGTYHPGTKTKSDIRLLTKLEKAMK